MGQKRQGGSTIGYVLIGIVLVASLVGGVYALRQPTAQKPVEVAVQPPENKKEEPQTNEQKPQTEEDQGKESPQAVQEPVAQPEPAKEEAPQTDNAQAAPSNTQPELPRTGAAGAGSWVIVGILAGAAVAYVRSRRFTLT
ncbi:LPXTG cell wall anchor domain-containing protein [Streptomyces caniscabiei]|uniref:LPXTG cell wall anchor domain-containing protein n=1 Tax=Streptomyces caniscabiei TaxID=2746961 RepID=UPI0029B1F5DD|nr:LPXTG cell wall anchor domain-containing protein [Streptomyces caniscabiei]MDX2776264.1 LPXTG cell wall anchor domain-containing protein [Streptomyces caniscabiei]